MKNEGPIDITRLNPKEVAKELTNQHFENYTQIQRVELNDIPWTKDENKYLSPNMVKMQNDFNQISYKIRDEILLAKDRSQQKERVEFYVKLMMECKNLNNFHAFSAILVGLSADPVSRILPLIDFEHKKEVDYLLKNFPFNNFKIVRGMITNAKGSAVPFLGLTATDLLNAHEQINKKEDEIEKNTDSNRKENLKEELELINRSLSKMKDDFEDKRKQTEIKMNNQDIKKSAISIGDWPIGALLSQSDVDNRSQTIKPPGGSDIFWGEVRTKNKEKRDDLKKKAKELKKILPTQQNEFLNKLKEAPKVSGENIAFNADVTKIATKLFPNEPEAIKKYAEVITTEQIYLKGLYETFNAKEMISDIYKDAKFKVNKNEMSHSECMELINKINELRVIQARFYEKMKNVKEMDKPDYFQKLQEKFKDLQKAQAEYVILYNKYGIKPIPDKVKQLTIGEDKTLNVQDLLKTPKERFSLYEPLFKDMINKMDNKDNPNYIQLKNFSKEIKRINDEIDHHYNKVVLDDIKKSDKLTDETIASYIDNVEKNLDKSNKALEKKYPHIQEAIEPYKSIQQHNLKYNPPAPQYIPMPPSNFTLPSLPSKIANAVEISPSASVATTLVKNKDPQHKPLLTSYEMAQHPLKKKNETDKTVKNKTRLR